MSNAARVPETSWCGHVAVERAEIYNTEGILIGVPILTMSDNKGLVRRACASRRLRSGLLGAIVLLAGLQALSAQTTQPAADGPGGVSATQPAADEPARYERAFIILVEDEISDVTFESIRRRTAEAGERGADLLIFEMNTPGGQVGSMMKITDFIKTLPQYTVAWVNTKAFSAGAVIAIACNEIVVAPRATIGDAMPIMMGAEGPQAISEGIRPKVMSPLLEEVRDSAVRNGYNLLLCESMIVPELEVFWIENTETGEQRFATRSERNDLFGVEAPAGVSATQPETVSVASRTDWQYVRSTPLLPRVKQPVVSSAELLTMSQNEAIAFGFAKPEMIADVAELEALYNTQVVDRLVTTWSEDLVAWLTSPLVRSGLLMLALLAGYMELNTPGLGVAGGIAVVCLALFLGAPYLAGLAGIWEILLVGLGIGLLMVEIFVIPGFGVAGVAGVVLLLVGLVMSFVPEGMPGEGPFNWPDTRYAVEALRQGALSVIGALVVSAIGMVLLSKYLRRLPMANRLVLANPTAQDLDLTSWFADLPHVGERGTTINSLRPAGKARFGTKMVDVVADSEFIEADQAVQVTERAGNRVVVRSVKAPDKA